MSSMLRPTASLEVFALHWENCSETPPSGGGRIVWFCSATIEGSYHHCAREGRSSSRRGRNRTARPTKSFSAYSSACSTLDSWLKGVTGDMCRAYRPFLKTGSAPVQKNTV